MKKFLLIAISFLFISNFCISNKIFAMQNTQIIKCELNTPLPLNFIFNKMAKDINQTENNSFAIKFVYYRDTLPCELWTMHDFWLDFESTILPSLKNSYFKGFMFDKPEEVTSYLKSKLENLYKEFNETPKYLEPTKQDDNYEVIVCNRIRPGDNPYFLIDNLIEKIHKNASNTFVIKFESFNKPQDLNSGFWFSFQRVILPQLANCSNFKGFVTEGLNARELELYLKNLVIN